MDKNQLEVKVGQQQDYINELEAAILPFSAFIPHLKAADVQRKAAVDIGVGVERLRTVIGLCEQINAREDVLDLEHDQDEEMAREGDDDQAD